MQTGLFPEDAALTALPRSNGNINRLDFDDRHFHDWYRFVLSFPAHLVREYLSRFELNEGDVLLDPFCGTGTTLVEAKRHGIPSIGIEANAIAHFACSVKTDWDVDPAGLREHSHSLARKAKKIIDSSSSACLRTLPEESFNLLLNGSISPLPLHKSLVLRDQIDENGGVGYQRHELLALAKSLVFSTSNLYFGPEVGVRRTKKADAPVIESWLTEVDKIVADLRLKTCRNAPATVYHADARQLASLLSPESISAVFTSPPYPNEKDYTRTTRLESVMLGYIKNREELRRLKKSLLRSNSRNVYKGDDDDGWVAGHAEIQAIAEEIEQRRITLGKTSGFERQYSKVTRLYFGGMARHLAELRPFLKPGAYLGYVVGDQASYLQVMIRTGQILADIARSLGYRVIGIDLFRTRLATATRKQMREEVVVLQWPGCQ
ncbi:MAG: DNA methyltransferase [Gammaproteobacteria bacterium]|nr:DNA methyltransferase [Gammaproteobacteria bacterium]